MSLHKNPTYQIPELIEALKAHNLEHDTPSQLADAFRTGWVAANTAPPLPAQVQAAEVTDGQADEIANACYRGLLPTGYSGGMGGQTWDRALVRAAIASRTPAPVATKLPKFCTCDDCKPMLCEGCIANENASTPAPGMAGGVGALSVRYVQMPESCGRNNWTALLYNGDKSECFTIARSEYPHRVRYEADRVRHIIGELAERPHILDYDADERTPCHLCGGTGEKDGAPCHGLKFDGTAHDVAPHPAPAPMAAGADAGRMDFVERNGLLMLDSVSRLPGGNGQLQVAATRANIDAAITAAGRAGS